MQVHSVLGNPAQTLNIRKGQIEDFVGGRGEENINFTRIMIGHMLCVDYFALGKYRFFVSALSKSIYNGLSYIQSRVSFTKHRFSQAFGSTRFQKVNGP